MIDGRSLEEAYNESAGDLLLYVCFGVESESLVIPLARVMRRILVDPHMGIYQYAKTDQKRRLIARVADLYQRRIDGDEPGTWEWQNAAACARLGTTAEAAAAAGLGSAVAARNAAMCASYEVPHFAHNADAVRRRWLWDCATAVREHISLDMLRNAINAIEE